MPSKSSIFPIDPNSTPHDIATIIKLQAETLEQSYKIGCPDILPVRRMRQNCCEAIKQGLELLAPKLDITRSVNHG